MGIRWQQMSFGRRGAAGAAPPDASTVGESLAHRAEVAIEMDAPPPSPSALARIGASRAAAARERIESLARSATLAKAASAKRDAEDDDEEDDAYDEESDPDAARFDDDGND